MRVCASELHKIIHLKFKYVHTFGLAFKLAFNTLSYLSHSFSTLLLPTETTVKKVPPSQSPPTPFNSYFVLSFRFQLQLLSDRHIRRYLIQFETHILEQRLRVDGTKKQEANWKKCIYRKTNAPCSDVIYKHRHTHTLSRDSNPIRRF